MIFLGDFSFVRIFLKNYRVTMTTTLELHVIRKIQWFCQQGEGFCMHVFSSIYIHTTMINLSLQVVYQCLLELTRLHNNNISMTLVVGYPIFCYAYRIYNTRT